MVGAHVHFISFAWCFASARGALMQFPYSQAELLFLLCRKIERKHTIYLRSAEMFLCHFFSAASTHFDADRRHRCDARNLKRLPSADQSVTSF